MKAVLISIQPKWCELIANGKKTIEVRKTKPKIQTPFKCYIYCTRAKSFFQENRLRFANDELYRLPNGQIKFGSGIELMLHDAYTVDNFLSGKVIGEFVCDKILPISVEYSDPDNHLSNREFPFTCLTDKQIMDYLGNGKTGYGWHISALDIYDEPKELSEFGLNRAPQSWCYVGSVIK